MPAAPSVVAESVLEGLVGGRLLAASSWPSSRRRPSRRRPFSRGLFGGRLLGSSLFGGGLLRRLPWPSSRRRPFRLRPFPQRLVGGSLVSGLAFLFQALLFLQLGLLALFLQARLFSGLGGFARLFLFLTLLLGLLQRDLRVDFRLGRLDLGFGRRREDPAASAARVPVAAWAEAGVWAVRAWAAAKRANCRSPRAALPPGRAFPCASSG